MLLDEILRELRPATRDFTRITSRNTRVYENQILCASRPWIETPACQNCTLSEFFESSLLFSEKLSWKRSSCLQMHFYYLNGTMVVVASLSDRHHDWSVTKPIIAHFELSLVPLAIHYWINVKMMCVLDRLMYTVIIFRFVILYLLYICMCVCNYQRTQVYLKTFKGLVCQMQHYPMVRK